MEARPNVRGIVLDVDLVLVYAFPRAIPDADLDRHQTGVRNHPGRVKRCKHATESGPLGSKLQSADDERTKARWQITGRESSIRLRELQTIDSARCT